MQLLIHNNLQPLVLQATRIVVTDDFGNPVAVAAEVDRGVIIAEVLGSPAFAQTLRNLGIHKTVIVTDIQQQPLTELTGR